MSGTHVYYNGILFRDCETLDYSCIVEYDESGTHEKYVRTRITVASTLVSLYNRQSSSPTIPENQHPSTIRIPSVLSSTDETTPARMEEIQERMSNPRRDFWYAVNGVTDPLGTLTPTPIPYSDRLASSSYRLVLVATGLFPSTVGGTDNYIEFFDSQLLVKRIDVLDANMGPKPSGLVFTKMYGGNVTRVQATFEICRVFCKPVPDSANADPGYDSQKVRGVIANSWNVVDGLDDDGAVTHTITGKLVVKDRRYKANAMRMCAFPLAFPYSRLVNRQYTVDQSGLVLEYQHQFKHAGASPPQGIRKYEATYTEMAGQGGVAAAGVFKASMSVRVMGWHDRSDGEAELLEREKKQKQVLIRGAMTILNSRITGIAKVWNAIPGQNPKTTNLVEAKVIERVGLPEIELQASVNYGDANKTEFISRLANMGNPIPIPDYDPRWWPVDNEWGRLPAGNSGENAGDSENPEFDNVAYPYAGFGSPDTSDYFDHHFVKPGNNRHSLARITGWTGNAPDESKEWARPGGRVPSDATSETAITLDASPNPISGGEFSAIVSTNLTGEVVLGTLDFVENDSFTGIADVQGAGFHYVAYASEVMNDTAQGKLSLPLSVPRDIPEAKRVSLFTDAGLSGGAISGKECSVAVSLCAPKTTRVYSVSCTRSQKWGEIPEPKPLIVRTTGSGSTQFISQVETLVNKEFLGETPVLRADGITREFTHHARYTYALSNPWRALVAEGANPGVGVFETIPVSFSPICKATSAENQIAVSGGDSPLFSSTVYG